MEGETSCNMRSWMRDVVPLAGDKSDEGVFRGFRLTEDTRTAATATSEESGSDLSLSAADDMLF